MSDDIGNMIIGDTKTRLDFPYKCKHCGKYVKINQRHPWQHDCIDEKLLKKIRSDENEAETIQKKPRIIKESFSKCYKHRIINNKRWYNLFFDWFKKRILSWR